MIVGEAPGENEVKSGLPFVGASGQELRRMLSEAGIDFDECFVTNVCHKRPANNAIHTLFKTYNDEHRVPGPEISFGLEQLRKDINRIRPNLIIAAGDTALWGLTGETKITKWRGSILPVSTGEHRCKLIPVYHPAAVLRQWSWRFITVLDLKRCRAAAQDSDSSEPPYEFITRPTTSQVTETLTNLLIRADRGPLRLSGDIETRLGHIACFGIGWSSTQAICIPFMCTEDDDGYFPLNEEVFIVRLIQRLFRHPNVEWVFQNGLYDYQYFVRYWRCVPRLYMDTMIAHHVCWPGDLPKGLDFISSMYNSFYRYWKDEGKEWDPRVHDEDSYWRYNCKDCVNTLEASYGIERTIATFNLQEQNAFQHRRFWVALDMMIRGLRTDNEARQRISKEMEALIESESKWFIEILGYPLNVRSPKQVQEFLYEDLRLKKRYSLRKNAKTGKKERRLSTDAKVLDQIWLSTPLARPFLNKIAEIRSLGVFKSTFINMKMDIDGRARCSFNVAGTETFRYSSSTNAFGSGGNLQNIPETDEDGHIKRGNLVFRNEFPNIRKLFIPDPGYIFFDIDLSGADAQVVACEANDEELKAIFREGLSLHNENAKAIFGRYPTGKTDPIYKQAKVGVHATNYGASSNALARNLGISIHEADRFIKKWFAAHPAIAEWHRRVQDSLFTSRSVYNIFGFRRYYLDRIETLLPEALAWIPQSTVALIVETAGQRIYYDHYDEDIQLLLQVHDSQAGQFPDDDQWMRKAEIIKDAFCVELPYDEPWTIPAKLAVSKISWGDCEEIK